MTVREKLCPEMSEICSKEVKVKVYYIKAYPERCYSTDIECKMSLDQYYIDYDNLFPKNMGNGFTVAPPYPTK